MNVHKLNIAIFSPNQNPYSETFIQAHKTLLNGNVYYYFGCGNQIQLESQPRLMPYYLHILFRLYAKLLKKESAYIWQKRILYSLKTNKIDVILVEYGAHAHHLEYILKVSRLPIITHFHGYDASVHNVIKACNHYKGVFQLSSKVIAVSKTMENRLLTIGCPNEKLVYNVYGPQKEFETIIPSYTKKQFLSIGRFTDKKAPYYIIMAFQEVVNKHSDAKLLMAGDGALLNMCKNLVRQFQLEKSVLFLGAITPQDYMHLLSESLAFVQHSITAEDGDMEGTPVAVLEASAAGLPIISTYHAGTPDVVINGETGFLVPEHDVSMMANKMMLLLNDIDLAIKLGMQGKEHVKNNFSLKRHIENIDNLIKQLAYKHE